MNKKLIMSVATTALALAAIGGATVAYFSDTEKSEGNLLTSGSIDIAVDGQNPWKEVYLTEGIRDLKPGGHEISMEFEVENVGKNPANVWKRLTNPRYDGGLMTEPECSKEDGTYVEIATYGNSSNCTGHTAVDDFGPYLRYSMNVDGSPLIEEDWDIMFGDMEEVWVPLKTLEPGEKMKVLQTYRLDADAGNEFQGDRLLFDVELYAEQMMGPGPVATAGTRALVLENKDTEHWLPIIADGKWAFLSWKSNGDYTLEAWGLDDSLTYILSYWNGTSETGISSYYSPSSGYLEFTGNYGSFGNPVGKYWLRPSNWDNSKTLWESNQI